MTLANVKAELDNERLRAQTFADLEGEGNPFENLIRN